VLIIVIILSIILIGSIILGIKSNDISPYGDWPWVIAIIVGLISGMAVLIIAAVWPAEYVDSQSFIRKYYSVEQTISDRSPNNIENAALTSDIIKINASLVEYQYWDKTFVGDTIDNRVEKLKPLK